MVNILQSPSFSQFVSFFPIFFDKYFTHIATLTSTRSTSSSSFLVSVHLFNCWLFSCLTALSVLTVNLTRPNNSPCYQPCQLALSQPNKPYDMQSLYLSLRCYIIIYSRFLYLSKYTSRQNSSLWFSPAFLLFCNRIDDVWWVMVFRGEAIKIAGLNYP